MTNSQMYSDLGEKMERFARSILISCISIPFSFLFFSLDSELMYISIVGGTVNVFVKYLDYLRTIQNAGFIKRNRLLKEAEKRHYLSIIFTIFSALLLYMIGANLIYESTLGNQLIFILIYLWHMILMVCQNLANLPLINWFKSTFGKEHIKEKNDLFMAADTLHYGTIIQALFVFPLITYAGLQMMAKFLKKYSNQIKNNLGISKSATLVINEGLTNPVAVDNSMDKSIMERLSIESSQLLSEDSRLGIPPNLKLHRIENSPCRLNQKRIIREFCIECGLNLPDEAIYCPNCGKEIDFSIKDMIIAN